MSRVAGFLVCISGGQFERGLLTCNGVLCACDSVAVLMACQDVEVAVGCRVVCRPALQHHHPDRKYEKQHQQQLLEETIRKVFFKLWTRNSTCFVENLIK